MIPSIQDEPHFFDRPKGGNALFKSLDNDTITPLEIDDIRKIYVVKCFSKAFRRYKRKQTLEKKQGRNQNQNQQQNQTRQQQYHHQQQQHHNRTTPIHIKFPHAFEKTPMYLFDPNVPKRIKTILPNTKIIVLLRDPVQRAYSLFKMNYIKNVELGNNQNQQTLSLLLNGTITFETCLEIDEDKLTQAGIIYNDTFWTCSDDERQRRWIRYWNIWDTESLTKESVCHGEIGRGLYYPQLKQWFQYYEYNHNYYDHPNVKNETLSPNNDNAILMKKKENNITTSNDKNNNMIFITKSESLLPNVATKEINLKPITDFIGVEEIKVLSKKKIHSFPGLGPMKNETLIRLQKLYAPFNKKLYSILGHGWEDPWSYDTF